MSVKLAQVDVTHYSSPSYFDEPRAASLSTQYAAIMSLAPSSVLEIGVGPGLLAHLLRRSIGSVLTMDIDRELAPDIVGSVTQIPLASDCVDLVACFQVLEHLPFDLARPSVAEMARVSSSHVVISVPDAERYIRLDVRLPRLGRRAALMSLPWLPRVPHTFDGQHYWELNKLGYPTNRILSVFSEVGLTLLSTYRVFNNPYHRLFILRKVR